MIALAPKVAGVEAEADAALKKQQGNQTKPMAEAVQALDWCVKHRTSHVTRHTSHRFTSSGDIGGVLAISSELAQR